jgi:hypothetical protein
MIQVRNGDTLVVSTTTGTPSAIPNLLLMLLVEETLTDNLSFCGLTTMVPTRGSRLTIKLLDPRSRALVCQLADLSSFNLAWVVEESCTEADILVATNTKSLSADLNTPDMRCSTSTLSLDILETFTTGLTLLVSKWAKTEEASELFLEELNGMLT